MNHEEAKNMKEEEFKRFFRKFYLSFLCAFAPLREPYSLIQN